MPKTFLLYVYNKNGTVRGVIRTLGAFGRADHSNTVTRVTWLMPVVVVGGTARHADTADRDQKGHMLGTVHRDCRQCNRLRSQPPLALSTTIKRPYTPRTVSCSGGRVAAAAAAAAVYIYTGWAKKTRTVFRFDNFVTVSPRKQSREKRYKTRISVV